MAAPSREEEAMSGIPSAGAADAQVAAHIWNVIVVKRESDHGTIMS